MQTLSGHKLDLENIFGQNKKFQAYMVYNNDKYTHVKHSFVEKKVKLIDITLKKSSNLK